jgi:hypothetical protein
VILRLQKLAEKRTFQYSQNDEREMNCSQLEELKLFLIREKMIWESIDMLNTKSAVFSGYFWYNLLHI